MRIWCLAPIPPLPEAPIERVHSPSGAYATFRSCLRWEFGFACALCHVHEVSLSPRDGRGVEGWGMVSVEHVAPQSRARALVDCYSNCVLVCMRCNSARQNVPTVDEQGRRLLDPTRDAWAHHFEIRVDTERKELRLEPRSFDRDAEYTRETYDLNDSYKATIRYRLYCRMLRCLSALEADVKTLRQLERLIASAAHPVEHRVAAEAAAHAETLRRGIENVLEELAEKGRAVPSDAPRKCACALDPLDLPPHVRSARVLVEYSAGDPISVIVRHPSRA
jgi:hypothetical protein